MQVQRTLVKSPPELWAEVSDVDALTRHLAEFGEITITRVEPETKVAWEGEHASGTVELTASGWGTKVTLTAACAEPEGAAEGAPEPEAAPESALEPASAPEPEASKEDASAPARRRWLRLWRRQAAAEPVGAEVPGPPAPPAPDPAPPAPPAPAPDPGPPPAPDPAPPAPAPDPSAPQIAFDPERTEAVLTQVLDDLGQAHHRPFSRS